MLQFLCQYISIVVFAYSMSRYWSFWNFLIFTINNLNSWTSSALSQCLMKTVCFLMIRTWRECDFGHCFRESTDATTIHCAEFPINLFTFKIRRIHLPRCFIHLSLQAFEESITENGIEPFFYANFCIQVPPYEVEEWKECNAYQLLVYKPRKHADISGYREWGDMNADSEL